MKVANIRDAIDYINSTFLKPGGGQHLLASLDGLIENQPGYITFRIYRNEFKSRDKDTLGHMLALMVPVLGAGYERTATAVTEEYVWEITPVRFIRLWKHTNSGTFIQLFDKEDT